MASRLLNPRTVLVGFGVAFGVLFLLSASVGIGPVVETLAAVEWYYLGGVLVVALLWLGVWSLSLYTVLRRLSVSITAARAFLVFTSATAANSLTPFAQMGGEALSAIVLSRATEARYETSLAAVAAVDVINLVPPIVFAFAGFTYLALTATFTPELRLAAGTLVAFSAAVLLLGVLVWHFHDDASTALVTACASVLRVANGFVGRPTAVDGREIERRIDSFFRGFERLLADRTRLALCLALSGIGWLFLATALWLSLYAVGFPVPPGVVFFVLPVAMIAIAVPLPGGVGGIETALVALIVGTSGLPLTEATAAVFLYRGGTYWFPLLLGGGATLLLEIEHRRRRR